VLDIIDKEYFGLLKLFNCLSHSVLNCCCYL